MPDIGQLYIAATPIGNLGDVTDRVKETLARVAVIACEDTRRTAQLLRLLNINNTSNRLISIHDHNEEFVSIQIIDLLLAGEDVVLVSDAGTPLLSDPGLLLIRQAFANNIPVAPLPGASSLSATISVCPIPLHEFTFVGFLARAGRVRQRQLEELARSSRPTVFFEAPQRVLDTFGELIQLGYGERSLFAAREISKKFEEYLFDSLNNVHATLSQRSRLVGEFVVVFDCNVESYDHEVEQLIPMFEEEGLKPTVSSRLIAKLTGLDRRDIYARLVTKH